MVKKEIEKRYEVVQILLYREPVLRKSQFPHSFV
jgi:hypothetical protein